MSPGSALALLCVWSEQAHSRIGVSCPGAVVSLHPFGLVSVSFAPRHFSWASLRRCLAKQWGSSENRWKEASFVFEAAIEREEAPYLHDKPPMNVVGVWEESWELSCSRQPTLLMLRRG